MVGSAQVLANSFVSVSLTAERRSILGQVWAEWSVLHSCPYSVLRNDCIEHDLLLVLVSWVAGELGQPAMKLPDWGFNPTPEHSPFLLTLDKSSITLCLVDRRGDI